VTLPYSVELNDIPMMIVQHHESEYWKRRAPISSTGSGRKAPSAKIMAMAIHPYISGQPHRIRYLEEVYDHIAGHDGVLHWNGTADLRLVQRRREGAPMSRGPIPAPEAVALPIAGVRTCSRPADLPRRPHYLEHVREMKEGADERDRRSSSEAPRRHHARWGNRALPKRDAEPSLRARARGGDRHGRAYIPSARALDHVYGYAIGIDLTRRDLQTIAKDKGWPWEMGKVLRPLGPCGPVHRPATWATGLARSPSGQRRVRQNSTTAKMTWSVSEIISKLSEQYELAPGDIIYTGTPEGVGAVVPGDRLEGAIEGLGTLTISIGPSKA
jgi:fumarylpyruvate hydrolase